jgi:hypothetical protein
MRRGRLLSWGDECRRRLERATSPAPNYASVTNHPVICLHDGVCRDGDRGFQTECAGISICRQRMEFCADGPAGAPWMDDGRIVGELPYEALSVSTAPPRPARIAIVTAFRCAGVGRKSGECGCAVIAGWIPWPKSRKIGPCKRRFHKLRPQAEALRMSRSPR